MSEPFIGEIKMFGGNFAVRRFAFCNGQIMQIAQNTALYSLLGTTFGGDGRTTFALPNLQSRAPLHYGQGSGLSNYRLGETRGTPSVSLTEAHLPPHTHVVRADTAGGGDTAPSTGAIWSAVPRGHPAPYTASDPNTTMSPAAIGPTGDSQPHNNMSPYLAVNFIIALQGVFPTRS